MLAPRFLLVFFLALPLVFAGCDSSDPADDDNDPPPVASPPDFNVISQPVTLNDGSAGLLFSAIPDDDVILVRVVISNPRNQEQIFNAGSSTVVENEEFPLQDAGVAYIRIGGEWTFTFVGRRATGDQEDFEVVETISVGA